MRQCSCFFFCCRRFLSSGCAVIGRTVDSGSAPFKKYDAVVIGGGHNGLTAAAYLARSGLSVAVLERRHLVGGAAVTEEIVPGFRFSRCSYLQSLLRPSVIRELELLRHGMKLLRRSPSSFTPCLDGRRLLLGPDADSNYSKIAKFSKKDSLTYPSDRWPAIANNGGSDFSFLPDTANFDHVDTGECTQGV